MKSWYRKSKTGPMFRAPLKGDGVEVDDFVDHTAAGKNDSPPAEKPIDSVPDEPLPVWLMKMTQSAFSDSCEHLFSRPPEVAGILLGPVKDDLVVTHFIPDTEGKGSPASFTLNTRTLNRELSKAKTCGLNCKGIVHSHPSGFIVPSSGDLAYLQRLFTRPANSELTQFFMPIVCDGHFYPYVFAMGRIYAADLYLI